MGLKIGVDVDGVLADFVTAYNEVILKETLIQVPPSDSYPDVWEYDAAAGVTKEQLGAIWASLAKKPHWWGMLHAQPGAPEALHRLRALQYDHDIYFITSRPGEKVKWVTEQWLAMYGYSGATVIITGKAKDKGLVAQGLHLDAFVEDNSDNLAMVMNYVPGIQAYLIDKPYNRGKEQRGLWDKGYIRVYSLNEALDHMLRPKQLVEAA